VIATAPTAGAASLFARAGQPIVIEEDADWARKLAALPIALLDSAQAALDTLSGIGVRTIGEFIALPRDGVARRFGQALLDEVDRAGAHLHAADRAHHECAARTARARGAARPGRSDPDRFGRDRAARRQGVRLLPHRRPGRRSRRATVRALARAFGRGGGAEARASRRSSPRAGMGTDHDDRACGAGAESSWAVSGSPAVVVPVTEAARRRSGGGGGETGVGSRTHRNRLVGRR